jgi:hypothetical protein
MNEFKQAFSGYDLAVMDYNGEESTKKTKTAYNSK